MPSSSRPAPPGTFYTRFSRIAAGMFGAALGLLGTAMIACAARGTQLVRIVMQNAAKDRKPPFVSVHGFMLRLARRFALGHSRLMSATGMVQTLRQWTLCSTSQSAASRSRSTYRSTSARPCSVASIFRHIAGAGAKAVHGAAQHIRIRRSRLSSVRIQRQRVGAVASDMDRNSQAGITALREQGAPRSFRRGVLPGFIV